MKTEVVKYIVIRIVFVALFLSLNITLCNRGGAYQIFIDEYVADCRAPKLSEYDAIFREKAQRLGWDWRMLASVVWNESRFNNDVVSSQGARGLMQFMPRTAERFGLAGDEVLVPSKSIQAGVEYLLFLERRFCEIADRDERIKFVLAGYNAGPGHVRDAMALAMKYGDDPHVWSGSVEKWLLALQEAKYYNDKACKHGFFRGRYTVRYVQKVFDRYYIYIEKK